MAATKTYTSQLCALAMLSAALEGGASRWDELARVPGLVEQAISLNAALDDKVARYRYAEHFVVVGRGFNYATAFEVALKMKETSYLVAEPYSPADLLHGPMAMIDRGFPVLLVAPSGRVLSDMAELAGQLERRNAELVAISDDPGVLGRARASLPLPAGMPGVGVADGRGRSGADLGRRPRAHARARPRPAAWPEQGHGDEVEAPRPAVKPTGAAAHSRMKEEL